MTGTTTAKQKTIISLRTTRPPSPQPRPQHHYPLTRPNMKQYRGRFPHHKALRIPSNAFSMFIAMRSLWAWISGSTIVSTFTPYYPQSLMSSYGASQGHCRNTSHFFRRRCLSAFTAESERSAEELSVTVRQRNYRVKELTNWG